MSARPPLRLTTGTALACAAALLVSGCSTTNPGSSGGGGGTDVLTVGMPNGPQTNNSNPFLGTSLGYRHVIYEPLVMTNGVRPEEKGKPWLATEWAW